MWAVLAATAREGHDKETHSHIKILVGGTKNMRKTILVAHTHALRVKGSNAIDEVDH